MASRPSSMCFMLPLYLDPTAFIALSCTKSNESANTMKQANLYTCFLFNWQMPACCVHAEAIHNATALRSALATKIKIIWYQFQHHCAHDANLTLYEREQCKHEVKMM